MRAGHGVDAVDLHETQPMHEIGAQLGHELFGEGDEVTALRFEPVEEGVRFTRTLSYEIRGVLALLSPFLDRQNRRISGRALENLTRRMESSRDARAAAA